MNDIKIFKQKFDPYLKNYLEQKLNYLTRYTKDAAILDYLNYIKIIILSDGKRIRPYLAFLMYQALGGQEEEKALKFLVSLEIFHSFCLVHDDIMDKASLRHGVKTANAYITDKLKKDKRIGDIPHVGNSQAILLGDLLLVWSQEIMNLNTDFNQETMNKIRNYFSEMANEVCIGQMIDVDITTRKKVSKELIDEKTQLKTAGYSFTKPLLIGTALCGKDNAEIKTFCKEFGLAMGIAFQTQDDLLDIISSDSKSGKTTSLDKSQNQHTYFTHFPSLEYGKKIIKTNFEQAKNLINNLSISESGKKKFYNLVDLIQDRTS
ncbi:MAG: polyprenyl synthetase family protein [bacterium]|nr:polyprenyl synthetase family protein [bacterium]